MLGAKRPSCIGHEIPCSGGDHAIERDFMTTNLSKPYLGVLLASLVLQVGCGKSEDPYKGLLKQMIGKWDRVNYGTYLNITPDGEVEEKNDENEKPGFWYWGELKMKSPNVMTVTSGNNSQHEFRMAGRDFIAVREWNPEGVQWGEGFVLERMK